MDNIHEMEKVMQNTARTGRNKIIFIMLFLAFILLWLNKPVFAAGSGTTVTIKSNMDTSVVLTDVSGDEYVGIVTANNDLIFSNLPYSTYTISCINQLDVVCNNILGVDSNNQFTLNSANSAAIITIQNEQIIKPGFYDVISKDNLFKYISPYVNTPAAITLTGDNPLILSTGETFTEPGYTATDPLDGDITSDVTVSGTIDTNTAGEYILTYTVTNSRGLVTSVTRTVTVFPDESNYTCINNY